MITTADLKSQTKRDLADTARQIGVTGWHSMRKDELIEAIRKSQRQARRKATRGSGTRSASAGATKPAATKAAESNTARTTKNLSGSKATRKRPVATKQPTALSPNSTASKKTDTTKKEQASKSAARSPRSSSTSRAKSAPDRAPTAPRIIKVLRKQQAEAESRKDLSACVLVHSRSPKGGSSDAPRVKDRLVLIVRDSYWLQASWEIARSTVERARAAMGADWHTAEPVLRLMEVADGASANTAEKMLRDIPIHGGVNNWYIDVHNPPCRFRVLVGYRASSGRLYTLCRSNVVQTPAPGACDPIDGHWKDIAEDYERIYSLSGTENGTGSNDLREMFEERLQRPMAELGGERTADTPDLALRRERDLPFEVDAELIVYGSTIPGATVTLAGEPVRLRPDGTFTVRMELPDKRQVLPVVASSRDGMRQRTTVVAVERNTKVMEPVSRHHLE